MLSPFLQSPVRLKSLDFLLLHRQFCGQVAGMLPMRTMPLFLVREHGILPEDCTGMLPTGFMEQMKQIPADNEPRLISKVPVLPLLTDQDEAVQLVLAGLDPELALKMAPEWLAELRQEVLTGLLKLKMAYVHPESGLYNSYLLDALLGEPSSAPRTLMLIAAMYRTRQATAALGKTIHIARLLEASAAGPLFYFGGNLFGMLHRGMGRQNSLEFARRLLGRLKREGLHRAHVGIAVEETRVPAGNKELVNECWPALQEAEKRGPFSLCEASYLGSRENHPLARPSPEIFRQLRRKWRDLDRFGLVLLRMTNPEDLPAGSGGLAGAAAGCLRRDFHLVVVGATEVYVLLPGMTRQQSAFKGGRFAAAVAGRVKPAQVEAGIAHWPCLSFSAGDTAVNCRKALLHGSFMGPGAVTLFDHISLNVSGDLFFDEGDYRQAVREYQAGLQLDKDDINLLNSLGVALAELNRYRQVVHSFDQVLALDRDNFMALINKGMALRMQGQHDEALRCFEQASRNSEFRASPIFSDISLQMARLYCAAGKFDRAVTVLENLEQGGGDRQGFHLYRQLGEAYAGAGLHKKAIAALQQSIRYNPQDAGSMSILGELYAREEQGDDIALSLCGRAVEFDDAPWHHWYRLAWVRKKTGDLDGALAAVLQALRRDRNQAEALLLAGRINQGLGRRKQAETMYCRVIRSVPEHREGKLALKNLAQNRKEK